MEKSLVPISVVIPTRNQAKFLKRCLASLFKQNAYPQEIVIIDNDSWDETKKVIDFFKKKLPIRYFWEKKVGYVFARNRGLYESKGKITAFLDSDCLPDKNWLKNIWNSHQSHKDSVIQGRWDNFLVKNSLSSNLYFFSLELYKKTLLSSLRDNFSDESQKKQDKKFLSINFIDTKNVSFPKNLIIKKKIAFDNSLPHSEDVDFGLQLLKKKIAIIYNPKIRVRHLVEKDFIGYWRMNFQIGLAKPILTSKWKLDEIKKEKISNSLLHYWDKSRKKFISNQEKIFLKEFLKGRKFFYIRIFLIFACLRKTTQTLGKAVRLFEVNLEKIRLIISINL